MTRLSNSVLVVSLCLCVPLRLVSGDRVLFCAQCCAKTRAWPRLHMLLDQVGLQNTDHGSLT